MNRTPTRYRGCLWTGLIGLLLSFGGSIAVFCGLLPEVTVLFAIASSGLWVVLVAIGILGAVSPAESEQSVGQVATMIGGAGV